MTTLSKRWISGFTTLALLTTSLVPVYAGRPPHKHKTTHKHHHPEESSAVKARSRSHRSTVEEVLQKPVQTTPLSSKSWRPDWLPEFVQDPLSTVVELVSSLLGINVEKTTINEAVASLAALPREAAHRVVKGVKYAVQHPAETLVLFLSAQVAVVSAFKGSQTQKGPMDALLSERSKRFFPIGNEFQISQNASENQYTTSYWSPPSIAALSNGNAFVVWQSAPTVNVNIYGSVFDPTGTDLGNEFEINQHTTGTQYAYPSITAFSNGNAFVAWQGNQTGTYDIYGRLFSSNGTALSNEFTINQNITGNQYNPSIAGLSNGNAFVVWYGNQTGNYENYGRIFYPNGTALSNEFGINQNITGNQYNPSIAALSNGNAFVVWSGYDQAGNYDLSGRVFDPTGTALGNEFTIPQITAGYPINPSVAAFTNGNAFVVWARYDDQTGNYNIYGRVFAPNGTALGNEFTINQITTVFEYNPSIAALSNDNAFVAWGGDYQIRETNVYDIYGRLFDSNGTTLSNEFQINQMTTGSQFTYPSIAALSNGNAFVAWQGSESGNNNIYNYGQIFNLSDPMMITGASMVTTGLQTLLSTTSLTPTTSSNNSYILPLLLGVGGVVGATCLGVSLIGGCAGVYGVKKYKKHQNKDYGNTKTINQELLEDSPYSKAILIKKNEDSIPLPKGYGNTETINRELLKDSIPLPEGYGNTETINRELLKDSIPLPEGYGNTETINQELLKDSIPLPEGYGNTETINQELLKDSLYSKAILVKKNEDSIPSPEDYGNTEIINQQLLENSTYSVAILVKENEK